MKLGHAMQPCDRHVRRTAVFGLLVFIIASCESPEQIAARQNQFNGKTIEEVIAVIGPPNQQTRSEAVWSFGETHIFHLPNTVLLNNKLVTVGTTSHEGVRASTYRS